MVLVNLVKEERTVLSSNSVMRQLAMTVLQEPMVVLNYQLRNGVQAVEVVPLSNSVTQSMMQKKMVDQEVLLLKWKNQLNQLSTML